MRNMLDFPPFMLLTPEEYEKLINEMALEISEWVDEQIINDIIKDAMNKKKLNCE